MASLRLVCISDLHLGAEYSVLTPLSEGGKPSESARAPTLEALAAALRSTVRDMSGSERPTLVLMGDVPDLSFSDTHTSAMMVRRFFREIFPDGEDPVFADEVLFLPGNHDHHLWRMVKDGVFVDRMREAGNGEIAALQQTTPLFDPPRASSDFLTVLLREGSGRAEMSVKIAYPNFGLRAADRSRTLVLHHGHFIESMYVAMSLFVGTLEGRKGLPDDVEQLEAENGGWIDYFWSELGSCGAVGFETTQLYQVLQDPAAVHATTSRVAPWLAAALLRVLPAGGLPAVKRLTEELTKAFLDGALGQAVMSERRAFDTVLGHASVEQLKWYLSRPVANQIRAHEGDGNDDPLGPTTFVFGHTHKPFEDRLQVVGYEGLVHLFNTGGWVIDETRLPTTQGGAVVMISDELSVASVRALHVDPNDGEPGGAVEVPVSVHGVRGPDDDDPWAVQVRGAVAGRHDLWSAFTTASVGDVRRRAELISHHFFDPDALETPIREDVA